MDNNKELAARLLTSASESEMGRNFAGTPQTCRAAAQALAAADARIAELEGLLQDAINELNACKDALAQVT